MKLGKRKKGTDKHEMRKEDWLKDNGEGTYVIIIECKTQKQRNKMYEGLEKASKMFGLI